MNNDIESVQMIKNLLVETFSQDSPKLISQGVKQIISLIDNYLIRLENFYNQIERNVNEIVKVNQQIDAPEAYSNYAIFKKLSYEQSTVTNLLREGYSLLDKIREFFTGETIKYQIGVEYYGKLYEFEMSMEELLSHAQATYNTKSQIDNMFKLRMNVGKKDLITAYTNSRATVISNIKGRGSYYSIIKDSVGLNMNKGNVYEAYRVYVSEVGGYAPPPDFDLDRFSNILTSVRQNTASSVQGGDLGDVQIKLFAKSAPSLMTTNTIRETLHSIKMSLSDFDATGNRLGLVDNLKSIFLKRFEVESTANQADVIATKKAEEYLEKQILSKFDLGKNL